MAPRVAASRARGGRRDRRRGDLPGHAARFEQAGQVAEQPEPGHIGRRVHADREHRPGRGRVESRHHRHRGRELRLGEEVALQRGREDARTDRFGKYERVAGSRPGVPHDPVRMHFADHRHAVLGLRVVDRVAAQQERPGLARHVCAAPQHFAEQVVGKRFARPTHQVEREERRRAHRVNVGERVGGGDASEVVWVVHNGREEVHRRHDRAVGRETKHGGVVAGGGVYEDPGIRRGGHAGPAPARRGRACRLSPRRASSASAGRRSWVRWT